MNIQDLSEAGVSEIELSTITDDDRNKLIDFLERTTLDMDQKQNMIRQIENLETPAEFTRLQQIVFSNMVQDKDRISMGLNYGANDIKKTLRQL